MKTTPNIKTLLIAGALLGLTSACQKESIMDNGNPNPATAGIKETLEAVNFTSEISYTLDAALAALQGRGNTESSRISACGTLIIDTLSSPKKLILDYGKTNCRAFDGHLRRGKLILTYTGDLNVPGSVFTYSTEDYYVDNNRYEGTRVITNTGIRQTVYGDKFNLSMDEDYTSTNGFTRVAIRTRGSAEQLWYSGSETATTLDDIFYVEGTQNVLSSTGMDLSSETSEFLRQDASYPFYVFGVVKFVRNDNPSLGGFSIDYGYPNRARDNKALLTNSDGTTQVITLF